MSPPSRITKDKDKGTAGSRPASLACTECRKQHLRCDAKRPTCSRCAQGQLDCHYQPSRRGGRRKPRQADTPVAAAAAAAGATAASTPSYAQQQSRRHETTAAAMASFVDGSSMIVDEPDDSPIALYSHRSTRMSSCMPEDVLPQEGIPSHSTCSNTTKRSNNLFAGMPSTSPESMPWALWPTPANVILTPDGSPRSEGRPLATCCSGSNGSGVDVDDDDDRFTRIYYENFHPAHPILVPRAMYSARQYPSYLQLAVRFVGSHYAPHASSSSPAAASSSGGPHARPRHLSSETDRLRDALRARLAADPDRSPAMVQAWLLLALVLHARAELRPARQALAQAAEMALGLGMHRAGFASSRHPLRSIEAESLRRTWWELYVADVLMGVPQRAPGGGSASASTSSSSPAFRCGAVLPEVLLPCDEAAYSRGGAVPQPRRMADFRRRVFYDDDSDDDSDDGESESTSSSSSGTAFSSHSYRIEAAAILCRVLVLNRRRDCHRDHLQAVENAMVGWANHLPVRKTELADAYGVVDEMMFQAHLIMAYAGMLLHLPRSSLQAPASALASAPASVSGNEETNPTAAAAAAAADDADDDPFWPPAPSQASSSFSSRPVHSLKAAEASRRVSDCVSVCPNIHKHTPLALPALALCGLVQLAVSSSHSEMCFDHHFNRVALVLGCLKSVRKTWRLADAAYRRLRRCAADTLSGPMDRMGAETLAERPSTGSTRQSRQGDRGAGGTVDGADAVVIIDTMPGAAAGPYILEANDPLLPDLVSNFIDPTCYNPSFFPSFADFSVE